MKFRVLLVFVIFVLSHVVLGQESQVFGSKTKRVKHSKEKLNYSVLFNSDKLSKFWEVDEKADQIVYNPDSMRQTDTYQKYIFSLKEFKEFGIDLKSKADLKITYRILNTESKKYSPSDPNMPSPGGGFTYISHYCNIVTVANEE